jgi:hypothetical protein
MHFRDFLLLGNIVPRPARDRVTGRNQSAMRAGIAVNRN